MKRFQYTIRIWKEIVVYANDMDDAMDRAFCEELAPEDFTVLSIIPTRCSEEFVDKTRIHEQN